MCAPPGFGAEQPPEHQAFPDSSPSPNKNARENFLRKFRISDIIQVFKLFYFISYPTF